jgi:hypothetical protein
MKLLLGGLILGAGLLAGTEAPATRTYVAPRPLPKEPRPRTLPVVHRTPGLRAAGSGTSRLRIFRLRADGYLCCARREFGKGSTWSRVPVTFPNQSLDWGDDIRITVKRKSSFRILIDSGHPTSFDSFEFKNVGPGTYVFTLDSLDNWRGSVDILLEYRGRVVRTRTVRREVMEHPAREYPYPGKRGPGGPLLVESGGQIRDR